MGYTVDRLAVLKILLHSAKYPSASINGLLLGTVSAAASGADQTQGEPELHIQDAIPLFHSFVTLALCLETALLQVDAYCHDSGKLRVVGYYHANERLNELDLKPYARRIADKVQQRVPQAVTLQVDNAKLSAFAEQASTDILQLWTKDGRGWVRSASGKLKYRDGSALSQQYMELLLQGRQAALSDFDDHLNDLAKYAL